MNGRILHLVKSPNGNRSNETSVWSFRFMMIDTLTISIMFNNFEIDLFVLIIISFQRANAR